MDHFASRTVFVEAQPTARQLRKARLVVVDGPDAGKTALIARGKTFVGRSAVNDLSLSDSHVSARHAEIEAVEDGFLLRDLGSTNGTFYAGARVRELYLAADLVVTFGTTRVRFEPTGDTIDIPLSPCTTFGQITGTSVAMREVFAVMEKVAPSELTVLIGGETGTGKERLARSIHEMSRRASGPYIVLDCSSIPRELAESTLFGHEKGSFTGAVASQAGAFELAHGGTIFLDEVGELPLELQPKLLRVLENREVRRIGAERTRSVDVRVVAATNRDLRAMVAEGTFREDLYFRLSVVGCELPPLRERREDIALLVEQLVEGFAARRPDLGPMQMSADAMAVLRQHTWPGNVRELKNVIERAVSLADRAVIEPHDLQLGSGAPPPRAASRVAQSTAAPEPARAPRPDRTVTIDVSVEPAVAYKDAKQEVLDRFEVEYLRAVMALYEGNLSRAAREVGLTRFHLRELLKKHGLREVSRGR